MDDDRPTFGQWMQRRRQTLHFTQQQLGQLAHCSADTIRKIEAETRRPSDDVARLLASALQIPQAEHPAFMRFARSERAEPPTVASAESTSRPYPLQPPSNVPIALTHLIGREAEIATVQARLLRDDVRLLTLTGPGGVGKTRLAQAVATAVRPSFRDGICFVDLTPLSDPELVLSTITQALEIKEIAGETVQQHVQSFIRDRQMLLVLDNFEQVVAAGLVVADLLSAAPRLRVLVTSRIPLHLRGEYELAIAPLALPGSDIHNLEQFRQYDAVRLFIERAQAVKADFQVTNTNAPAVAEICARLDGLPLAIELAAARVKVLPPEALLKRLSNRLQVLTGGPRDLPTRQQTIRAAIDWSHDLLEPDEQTLFARLAVFVGGWTLEAAETVSVIEGEPVEAVLDVLQSLLNKNLIQQDDQEQSSPRFRMLETIREYALERLSEGGEADRVRQQHAAYYLSLVKPTVRQVENFDTPKWLTRLDAEHDNLRAVMLWAGQHDILTAVEMAASLKDFWYIRGYWSEGQRWIEGLLPLSAELDAVLRSRAWDCAGVMASLLGDHTAARTRYEQALAHAREAGFVGGQAFALRNIGVSLEQQGELDRAFALYEQSLELYRQIDNQGGIGILLQTMGHAWATRDPIRAEAYHLESLSMFRVVGYEQLIAYALINLAELTLGRGAVAETRAYAEECLALARNLDSPDLMVDALLLLGAGARIEQARDRAAAAYREGLQRAHSWGDARWTLRALDGIVALALEGAGSGDDFAHAARLGGTAEALRERYALPRTANEHQEQKRLMAAARAQADAAAFDAAWDDGRTMTLEQAVAYALETSLPGRI